MTDGKRDKEGETKLEVVIQIFIERTGAKKETGNGIGFFFSNWNLEFERET